MTDSDDNQKEDNTDGTQTNDIFQNMSYTQQMSSTGVGAETPLIFDWIIAKGFNLKEPIGSGQYATVYRASWDKMPGVDIACKRLEIEELDEVWRDKCLNQEMNIMKRLKHPNIIQVYQVFKTRRLAFIFMQLAENGTIKEHLKRVKCPIKETQAKLWFMQLMAGLSYMHSKGIAHRDIKPDNFLLDSDWTAILSDFGFAVIDEKHRSDGRILKETICGSAAYMAPEVHTVSKKKPYDAKAADLFSMGVCLFEMVNYDQPFPTPEDAKSLPQLVRHKKNRKYKFHAKLDLRLSADFKDLIHRLLEPNPQKRITIKQITEHKSLQ